MYSNVKQTIAERDLSLTSPLNLPLLLLPPACSNLSTSLHEWNRSEMLMMTYHRCINYANKQFMQRRLPSSIYPHLEMLRHSMDIQSNC